MMFHFPFFVQYFFKKTLDFLKPDEPVEYTAWHPSFPMPELGKCVKVTKGQMGTFLWKNELCTAKIQAICQIRKQTSIFLPPILNCYLKVKTKLQYLIEWIQVF